ncbi:hypothetical protein CPB84DRAFT_217551 [Gymnopilus junonius]|uniref:Uncharacterized protein n=1 Tax=Gymnopilus junonius TaxID=109634 RepID=A0A9P5NCS1_GYMJU|nr:hypothetical protein CPB84DRAFT_217551 [Gymnopilus junonius]
MQETKDQAKSNRTANKPLTWSKLGLFTSGHVNSDLCCWPLGFLVGIFTGVTVSAFSLLGDRMGYRLGVSTSLAFSLAFTVVTSFCFFSGCFNLDLDLEAGLSLLPSPTVRNLALFKGRLLYSSSLPVSRLHLFLRWSLPLFDPCHSRAHFFVFVCFQLKTRFRLQFRLFGTFSLGISSGVH